MQLYECSDELVFARVHDLMVHLWRSPITSARVQRVETYSERMRAEQRRFCGISLMEVNVLTPPDTAAVKACARLADAFTDCTGVALVIEGTEVTRMVLRLAFATLSLVTLQNVPKVVFESVEAASGWLCKQTSMLSPSELSSTIAAIRTQAPR